MAIVKMKKATVITMDQDREGALDELRAEGVVHLERIRPVSSNALSVLESELANHRQAMAILPETEIFAQLSENREYAQSVVDQALEITRSKEEAHSRLIQIQQDWELLAAWDSLDPADLTYLEEGGVYLRFYRLTSAQFELEGHEYKLIELGKEKGFVLAMAATQSADTLPPFESVQFPEKGVDALQEELKALEGDLQSLDMRMVELAKNKPLLDWYEKVVSDEIKFEEARLLCEDDEGINYLSGYVPLDCVESLKESAKENAWGLVLDDPTEEDAVPTELKLGKFSSILSPVLDFLGILPGYREYDISFFFLCFFSVFTAMLIGDAGYGLIFLGVTFGGMIAFMAKKKPIPKAFFMLLLLSITTIAWGIVTGTWFASQTIAQIPIIDSMKLDVFKVTGDEQIALIMGISFFLGIIQLLIGVVQNFKKNFPKKSSFAQIGWFAVLIAVYYLVLTLVVERSGLDTYPQEMLYLLLGGVVIIFLFGGQEEGQSFLKGILNSFANFLQLFLDVVGTFSDLMSYVRLFAVGLASVKIAETFNQLGAGMSEGWMMIFGVLIIVIGHTLNIVLGLMAILVHAVRLNILEYSGKVGVEWSGFKYEPFKVSVEESQN